MARRTQMTRAEGVARGAKSAPASHTIIAAETVKVKGCGSHALV